MFKLDDKHSIILLKKIQEKSCISLNPLLKPCLSAYKSDEIQ